MIILGIESSCDESAASICKDGKILSLKRFKDDVSTVDTGLECGIAIEGIKKYLPGDKIIAYKINEIQRKLS